MHKTESEKEYKIFKSSKIIIKKIKKYIHRQFKIDRLRFFLISFMLALALIATIMSSKSYFQEKEEYINLKTNAKEINWKKFVEILNGKEVKEIQYNYYRTDFFPLGSGNIITFNEILLNNGKVFYYKGSFDEEKLKVLQPIIFNKGIKENKLAIDHTLKESTLGRMFSSIFMIMGLITLLLLAQRAFADLLVGKNFELTRNNDNVTFKDIIGYDEVKREFQEAVIKLKDYDKFAKRGLFPPKGMLLTGPPGVGKTLFAKAFANECKASFLYATGSDFVELYVGTGARRVRSIFNNARYMAPCIIFIDEIDALGKRDGYGMDSERLSTINQILSEMDGLNENKAVLVLAATNHIDKIDEALLRPGRFDKKINFSLPDLDTRKGILQYYSESFENSIDFDKYAKITAGMSGADLKNLIEEAKNFKLREIISPDEDITLTDKEMNEAIEVVLLGVSPNKSHKSEIERVAIHELGHALTGYIMDNNIIVQKISIAGRGQALGYTFQSPKEELKLLTYKELQSQIISLLGGRAAEDIIFGNVSNGASDDLLRVNTIVQKMVCEWGMGKKTGIFSVIPKKLGEAKSDYNQDFIEKDINEILNDSYTKAKLIIEENKEWILSKKILLIEKVSLEHEEIFNDLKIKN